MENINYDDLRNKALKQFRQGRSLFGKEGAFAPLLNNFEILKKEGYLTLNEIDNIEYNIDKEYFIDGIDFLRVCNIVKLGQKLKKEEEERKSKIMIELLTQFETLKKARYLEEGLVNYIESCMVKEDFLSDVSSDDYSNTVSILNAAQEKYDYDIAAKILHQYEEEDSLAQKLPYYNELKNYIKAHDGLLLEAEKKHINYLMSSEEINAEQESMIMDILNTAKCYHSKN